MLESTRDMQCSYTLINPRLSTSHEQPSNAAKESPQRHQHQREKVVDKEEAARYNIVAALGSEEIEVECHEDEHVSGRVLRQECPVENRDEEQRGIG